MPGRLLASLHAYACTGNDFFRHIIAAGWLVWFGVVCLISPFAGQEWTRCKYLLPLERSKGCWYTFFRSYSWLFYPFEWLQVKKHTSIPYKKEKKKNTSIEGRSRTCLSSEDYEAPDRSIFFLKQGKRFAISLIKKKSIVSKQWSHVHQTATLKDSYRECFRAHVDSKIYGVNVVKVLAYLMFGTFRTYDMPVWQISRDI